MVPDYSATSGLRGARDASQRPPVARHRASVARMCGDIHDDVAHAKECLALQRLGEEIRQLQLSRAIDKLDLLVNNKLLQEGQFHFIMLRLANMS